MSSITTGAASMTTAAPSANQTAAASLSNAVVIAPVAVRVVPESVPDEILQTAPILDLTETDNGTSQARKRRLQVVHLLVEDATASGSGLAPTSAHVAAGIDRGRGSSEGWDLSPCRDCSSPAISALMRQRALECLCMCQQQQRFLHRPDLRTKHSCHCVCCADTELDAAVQIAQEAAPTIPAGDAVFMLHRGCLHPRQRKYPSGTGGWGTPRRHLSMQHFRRCSGRRKRHSRIDSCCYCHLRCCGGDCLHRWACCSGTPAARLRYRG